MKTVLGLLFLVEKDLSQPVNREVHVGDSSDRGFGLMVRKETPARILREMCFEERWRCVDRSDAAIDPPVGAEVGEESHVFRGTTPQPGLGTLTRYGDDLRQKADEQFKYVEHKKKLFGKTAPQTS